MGREPVWIRIESVLAIHQSQIADHGGMPGVRDHALLESAVARPRQLFTYKQPTPALPLLAAAYGYGIIRNHPFLDGNKRTGLITLGIFLELNGLSFLPPATDIYKTIISTAAGDLSEEQIIAWVKKHSI